MKKWISLLIALMVFCGACAFALNGANYPAWDESSAPDNALAGSIAGQMLALEFDAVAEYSNIADGMIQACFFAFDESEANYLELYLKLPENIAAGDVLSASDVTNAASVSLYEVAESYEDFYFASQVLGLPYPAGCSYEIRIDAFSRSDASLSVSGALNARLCRMQEIAATNEYLDLQDVRFQFELPLGAAAPTASAVPEGTFAPAPTQAPENTQAPIQPMPTQAPRYTMDPHPDFTLPPDYRVI